VGDNSNHSCTCGGANENCFRCFGTGRVAAHNNPSMIGAPSKSKRKRNRRNEPSAAVQVKPTVGDAAPIINRPVGPRVFQCNLCKFWATIEGLAHHKATCHVGPAASRKLRKQCDLCGWSGRKWGRHMKTAHGHSRSTAKKTGAGSTPSVTIVPSNQTSGKQIPPNSRPAPHSEAFERWKKELEEKQLIVRQPNLDYTKPYAHAARENGRFGSHPSHDGFDDESSS
jgi:hypothetical protein